MKILQRYILSLYVKNFLLSLLVFTLLFLVFDFFDRIDDIAPEDAPIWLVAQYFVYKVPLMLSLMIPVSMLISTLLTLGLLSKNSEITAMRAAGVKVLSLTRPLLIFALVVSLFSIFLNETVVPYTTRRGKEIYNIDIRQKSVRGGLSQSDFWWRSQSHFYSVSNFDSRTNTLHDLSKFELSPDFQVHRRTEASEAQWVPPAFGWTLKNVREYRFAPGHPPSGKTYRTLPLPIGEQPSDFYEVKTDPHTMSFYQLRKFIKRQVETGINASGYLSDLHAKISFPFISLIVVALVIPFSVKHHRSGGMPISFIGGLVIGFTYYAVHSFSVAMGRAEIFGPVLSAWMANMVMGVVALILNLGTEAP